jgi:hypothetical protein
MPHNPSAMTLKVGDTVRCIDASSRADWAAWYGDDAYCDLVKGQRYLVRATLIRDGQFGLDVGIPTPWGDPYWSANRFERALLRLPSTASERVSA